jgi:hypothetical protein
MINRFLAVVLATMAITMSACPMNGSTDKSGASKANTKGTQEKSKKEPRQKSDKRQKNKKPKQDRGQADEDLDRLLMGIYG